MRHYFENCIKKIDSEINEKPLSKKKTHFNFKMNKSAGFDERSFNIVRKYFGDQKKTKKVPQKTKIAKMIPIFKANDTMLVVNYRQISVLPCFSKELKRNICNLL